jgi:endonuclease YncB( thermonuclease family)
MYTFLSILMFIIIIFVLMYDKKEENRQEDVINSVLSSAGLVDMVVGNELITNIIDGDTIEVNGNERIRLANVDAYESNSPLNPEIMDFMNKYILGEYVSVIRYSKDKYQRTVASIILPSGVPLSVELVKRGYAKIYEQYADKSSDEYVALKRAEDMAKVNKVGGYGLLLLDDPWVSRHINL